MADTSFAEEKDPTKKKLEAFLPDVLLLPPTTVSLNCLRFSASAQACALAACGG